jgi:hypothetical protein
MVHGVVGHDDNGGIGTGRDDANSNCDPPVAMAPTAATTPTATVPPPVTMTAGTALTVDMMPTTIATHRRPPQRQRRPRLR